MGCTNFVRSRYVRVKSPQHRRGRSHQFLTWNSPVTCILGHRRLEASQLGRITLNASSLPMTVLQFAPFSSLVQPAFWHELTNLKIDVLRLSDDSVPVNASYSLGKSIKDRETGKEIALGCNLTVGGGSFNKDSFQYAFNLLDPSAPMEIVSQ